MGYSRRFVIEIVDTGFYVKEIYKNNLGYFCRMSKKIENARKWRYKKNCERGLNKLRNELDPRKIKFKTFKLDILEITDIRLLRKIKISKINKK